MVIQEGEFSAVSADRVVEPRNGVASLPKQRVRGFQTRAVHCGEPSDRCDGAIVQPIFQTSTFSYLPGEHAKYTRCNNNPNQVAVAAKIAALEGAAGGAFVTASGMAAITGAVLSFVETGDHVLVQSCLYGGTFDLVHKQLGRQGIEFSEIDATAPESWEALLKPKTKVIYVESIANPLTDVPNLPAVVAFARQHGLVSMIDNTFTSAVNYRPLEQGFDISVQSCTKYCNGHSDVIAGSIAFASSEHFFKVLPTLIVYGGSLDPHSCFLLQRGLKTLGLRMRQHNANAQALAEFLEKQPQVTRVCYPGLRSHPQHALAAAAFEGCGGVLSFELRGGEAAAEALFERLTLAAVAPSLGGVETLITRPVSTTHMFLKPEERQALGITDGFIRVAVGIEDTADIIEDFKGALEGLLSG